MMPVFKLSTANTFYTAEGAKQMTEAFGFEFEDNTGFPYKAKRKVTHEVDYVIETLDELLTFCDEWGDVVVGVGVNGEPTITIYDGYLE